jgi:tRNA(Ile)-lysidine synthetase-like protein
MKTQTDDIVRPFLQVPRDAILESIQRRGLGFRTDSSNQDPRFDRNRLRQVVMPALERYRPGSARILARVATVAQADAELIADSTEQALSLMRGDESRSGRASHSVWKVLHPSLRRQIVRALSAPFLDNSLDTEHVELLCRYLEAGRSPPPGQMPGGLTVQIEDGDIVVRQGETQPSPSAFEEELSVPGLVVSPGGELRAEILSRPAEDDLCRWLTVLGPLHALCDSATIGDRLVVRRRRPGDRLTPLGMSGTRKLQDILVDRHVPRVRRDELPVVVAAGRIIWVPGVVQAAHSAVSPSSDRLLHLVFAPAGGRAPW